MTTLKDWLREVYIAQQALETAASSGEVVDMLREILAWMLGDNATLQILYSRAPEAFQGLPPLAQEAASSLTPQASEDDRFLALPLVASDEAHGVVIIDLVEPIQPQQAGLISALVHIAATALARLSWEVSPQIFRQLVENANVAIDVASLDGTVTYANLAAAQLYGFESPEEMIGRNISDFYYGDEEQRVARDLIVQSRTVAGWSGDVIHKMVDGSPLPVRLAVFAMRDYQYRMTSFGAIVQSLGEQQRLLFSLQQQTRRLRAAVEVARAAISELDLDSLISQAASVTQVLFSFDLVAVLLAENNRLVPKVVYTPEGRLSTGAMDLSLSVSELNETVLKTRQAIVVSDTSNDERRGLQHGILDIGSELVLPMRLGERVIGTLDVQSGQSFAFQPEDVETLQGIADQLAVAVENARLFAAERSKVEQLAALNAISQRLAAAYDIDDLWSEIYRHMAELFEVSTFFVMRYDAPSDQLQVVWLYDDGEVRRTGEHFPLTRLAGYVVRTGAPFYIDDLAAQAEMLLALGVQTVQLGSVPTAKSWYGVPLRARDGTIFGVISVQSEKTYAFGSTEQQLLTTIATQVSLAMENARLFNQLSSAAQQLKERAKRIEALYRIGSLLSTSLDRNRILKLAAEQIVKLLKVDHCGIVLLTEEGQSGQIVAEYPDTQMQNWEIQIEGNPIFDLHRNADLVVSNDITTDERLLPIRDMLSAHGIKSTAIARMSVKGRTIGSIGVDAMKARRDFSYEEVETLRTLAAQVALSVENADLYAQALAANELKSQFLATMSHELRTPLNAIMGYTEMVVKGVYGALTDKQRDRLIRVYDNAEHLLALINDVLDLAKIESGRMTLNLEPLDLAPLINGVMTQIAPLAEAKRLQLVAELTTPMPLVEGDTIRLRQIILNLMSNAVKFTREGQVSIRTFTHHLTAPQLGLWPDVTLPAGNWLCVAVKDSGIGIAKSNFKLIFDAFRQVDGSSVREFQGTGLGLPITRQLVEMHKGKLWLESELGQGSTFTFALPILDPAQPQQGEFHQA